jgi:simple sugar transport system ATP-binding protein
VFTTKGYAIIFISHKLDEVLEIADRITVLRGGKKVATLPASECDQSKLATLMVGRQIGPRGGEKQANSQRKIGPIVLQLAGVSALNERGLQALTDVDLAIHAGEIVGVAGVAGNGQRELTEVLTGIRAVTEGQVRIGGKVMDVANPAEFLKLGVGHIPEDRLRSGLAPAMAVSDNSVLREYRIPPVKAGSFFRPSAAAKLALTIVKDAQVLVPNMGMPVRNLSGGNQQRLVARREMRVAIETMQRYIIEMRDAGIGVLLISEELEELLTIADRVAVLFQGRIMGVFATADADAERIGLLMGGRAEMAG